MAGADYDYTKSLLPAGNGAIHAMSGGGRGDVQEGGALGEDKLGKIFDFDDFGSSSSHYNYLTLMKEQNKEEILLLREFNHSIMARLHSEDPLINELLKNPDETKVTYEINVKKLKTNILYDLTASLRIDTDKKNVSVQDIYKTPPTSERDAKDRKFFLRDVFNILFEDPSLSEITLIYNFIKGKIYRKKQYFIPKLIEIKGNITKIKLQQFEAIKKNKSYNDYFTKPIPSSTTSSPHDFEKEATDLIAGIKDYSSDISTLKTEAGKYKTSDASKEANVKLLISELDKAVSSYAAGKAKIDGEQARIAAAAGDVSKQAVIDTIKKIINDEMNPTETALKTAMDALRAAIGGGGTPPPPPPPPPGDHDAQVKAIIDSIKDFNKEIADLKQEADKKKGDATIDAAVTALDTAKRDYDTAVQAAQTKAGELAGAADDAEKDKIVADLTALQPGIATAQTALEAAITTLSDAITAATATTANPPQEITISYGSKDYELQIPVSESDFTNLDEPGKESLKEIYYDFGLDLVKDNKKAAAFVNGLAECHTMLNAINNPKCAIVKAVATEVLKAIVSYDMPGATPPPTSKIASMATTSAATTTTPPPPTSLWTCASQPAPVDYSKLPDPAGGKPAAGLYAVWINPTTKKTHLLIHKRSQTVSGEKGAISTPGGSVDGTETFPQAAAREASEEAGYIVRADELRAFSIPPPPPGMTTEQNKVYFYHVVESDTAPTVNGPSDPKFAGEMDQTFDFAGIDGEVAGTNTYHYWAEIIPLLRWLEKNISFSGTIYNQVKQFLLPYLCMTDTGSAKVRDYVKEAQTIAADIQSVETIITELDSKIQDLEAKKIKVDAYKAELQSILGDIQKVPNIDDYDKIVANVQTAVTATDFKTAEAEVDKLNAIFTALKAFESRVATLKANVDSAGGGTGPVKKGKTKGIYNFTGLACYFVTAIQFLNNIDELRDAILLTDPKNIGDTQSSRGYLKHTNVAEYEKKKKIVEDAQTAWNQEWNDTFGPSETKPAQKKAKATFALKETAYLTYLLDKAKLNKNKQVITKEFIRTAIIILKKGKDYLPDADKATRDNIITELKVLFKTAPTKAEQDKKTFTGDELATYTDITTLYDEYQTTKIVANKALDDSYSDQATKESFIERNFTSKITAYSTEIADITKKIATDKDFGKTKITESFTALQQIFAQLNDDTIDLSTEDAAKAAKIGENFEKIRQFTPGTAQGCSQEDSQEFIIKIIFPLIQCYSKIDKIINDKFIVSKDTTRTCRDDTSIKKVTSEIMSFLKLEYADTKETTVDDLLKRTKTSGWTENLEACNELADADADELTEVKTPDTNKYVLIQISRAAGSTGVAGVNNVAVKPNFELTIDGKKYIAQSAIVRRPSSSLSSSHYVMQVLKKDDTTGFAVTDYELNDGRVVKPPGPFIPLNQGGIVYLYKREGMTGGSRQRHTRGKTMRTTSKAVSEQSTKRTLKARTSTELASSPSLAQTKRRHLKARTTQSRTERSRVSGRLPIRRAGGK